MRNPDRPVALAAIIGAHGVTGEVRLKLLGDGIDSLKKHKRFNQGTLTLTSLRPNKAGAIARFAEIADRNAAEAARGTQLDVPRSALPPLDAGEYYHVDLIGMPCIVDGGDAVGEVTAVANFGAGDVLDVRLTAGKTFMVPLKLCDIGDSAIVVPSEFLP